MITCPNCNHANMEGSLFCGECGTQLPLPGTEPAAASPPSREDGASGSVPDRPGFVPALHMLATGHVLPLGARLEFTLGRTSEGQPIVPDIDLSPYEGYASGVSRLHAMIRREGDQVAIIDLGSSNGTFVNGTRLTANVEHALRDGDIVALGKLRMQLLLQVP